MLFLAWIGALVLYCFLYLVWEALQNHLQGPAALLQVLNNMIMMPDHLAFVLLRGLLLATLFYLVADQLLSTKRQLTRKIARTKSQGQTRL